MLQSNWETDICCTLTLTTILTCPPPEMFKITRDFFCWVPHISETHEGSTTQKKHPDLGDKEMHTGPPSGTRLRLLSLGAIEVWLKYVRSQKPDFRGSFILFLVFYWIFRELTFLMTHVQSVSTCRAEYAPGGSHKSYVLTWEKTKTQKMVHYSESYADLWRSAKRVSFLQ